MNGEPQKSEALWRLVPLAEFKATAVAPHATLRKKFELMLKRLRSKKHAASEHATPFKNPPAALLDRAAPQPSADDFCAAVDFAVDDWLRCDEPKSRLLAVVSPPCTEMDLMRQWADRRRAEIASEPSSEEILAGDLGKLPSFDGGDLLVIPKLEAWFRRHHGGLVLVRELIARLTSAKRRCVVGINSWAWTYLVRAADAASELPNPLTLAAFDDAALRDWLSDLAKPAGVVFCRDDTGQVVLDPSESGSASGKSTKTNGRADFLKSLAAAGRGSPWHAWHLFRRSMRVEGKNGDTGADGQPDRRTVWVSPAMADSLPEMNKDARSAALLALHALLIHGELNLDDLATVLPPIRISHLVHRLAADELLLERDGKWRVAPTRYPAVREALAHDGFPLDPL